MHKGYVKFYVNPDVPGGLKKLLDLRDMIPAIFDFGSFATPVEIRSIPDKDLVPLVDLLTESGLKFQVHDPYGEIENARRPNS